jgi:integrase
MGRVAKGWSPTCRRGVYGLRFTYNGRQKEISTRSRDSREAAKLSEQIYADFISGNIRGSASGKLSHPTTEVDDLISDWLDDISSELGDDTGSIYTVYGRHWLKCFRTLADVTSAKIGEYQRARLAVVKACTVSLERSALKRFLLWLVEREHISDVPVFPKLPKKATGTPFEQRRRQKPTSALPEQQIYAIVDELEEWSKRRSNGKQFPIRARFLFSYETGLRPKTISNIRWSDVTEFGVHVRGSNDKNRWDRVVPISDRARAALETIGPGERDELVFGRHDLHRSFRAAAVRVLGPELAATVAPYDLKHARVTGWFEEGKNELGIQFLTGTKNSIRRYAHASRRAAEMVLGDSFQGHTRDGATQEHQEQQEKRQAVKPSAISYTKQKSKNTGNLAVLGRKKA